MVLEQSNKTLQGIVGQKIAELYYTILGYAVLTPSTDAYPYDIIIEKDGVVKRVQVKTTKERIGESLRVTHKGVNSETVDLLFVYTRVGDCYEIPVSDIDTKHSLRLTKEMDKYIVWSPRLHIEQ